MDIVTKLMGFPHILTAIFSGVSHETLLAAEQVSSSWKSVLSLIDIWRTRWRKNEKVSPMWKILSTRMEHREPNYREADKHVEGNIGRILECSIIKYSCIPTNYTYSSLILGESCKVLVDHRYIYSCFKLGKIRILNRWTRKCIKIIDPTSLYGQTIMGQRLSERHLTIKLRCGTIVIYDLATLNTTQIIRHNYFERKCGGGFCVTSDILVNCCYDADRSVLIVRKFNHETGLFGPGGIMVPLVYDSNYREVYCWDKYIIVDTLQKNFVSYAGRSGRTVTAFDMESVRPVKEKNFTEPYNIITKRECHDGTIVSFDYDRDCLVTWNVGKDIVQPIKEHSRKQGKDGYKETRYSARVDHHPDYQYIISESNGKINLDIFKIEGLIQVQSKTFDENSSKIMMRLLNHLIPIPNQRVLQTCYFDGVQLIFMGIDSDGVEGLHIFEFGN